MKRLVPAVLQMVMVLMLLAGCGGGGGSTAPGGTTTDTTAPSTPAGLVAAASSSSLIALNWTVSTDNTGVTGYKIYRGGTQISTSTTNAFSDSGLTASTSYAYTVAAYDAAGNTSAQSTSASATTLAAGVTDTTAPTAPTNLTASAISATQINLAWTASTDNIGIAGYEVWRGATMITTVTTTSYSDTGLLASTAYTYIVKAFDAAANVSAASNSATATTLALVIADTTPPSVPTNLVTAATSTNQIDLTWTASTDAVGVTGYKIYRDGTYLNATTAISSSDTGLTAATQYCYQVTAYDAANNESAKSTQACARTSIAILGANLRMPDTNQTMSYTATFGEDHDYTINPPSYTDNGDGTITDNVTTLIWQKQDDAVGRKWADAITYCDNLYLGGQTDWRQPSRIELVSLFDSGIYLPAINTTYFPNTSSVRYWSSTTYVDINYAWGVDFELGAANSTSNYNIKAAPGLARCVRGGYSASQDLTDNGNGTVTDNGTHLMWQQGESSLVVTWEAALTYCEGLSLAGANDWRLPNHKEFLSLVDDTREYPSINTAMFPGTQSSLYWSSTTYQRGSWISAWLVEFAHGDSDFSGKTYTYNARCVRGGQ